MRRFCSTNALASQRAGDYNTACVPWVCRFGPISRKVFLTILQTRRELEAAADEDEDQD